MCLLILSSSEVCFFDDGKSHVEFPQSCSLSHPSLSYELKSLNGLAEFVFVKRKWSGFSAVVFFSPLVRRFSC